MQILKIYFLKKYLQEAAAKLALKLKLKAKQAAAHRLEGSAVSGI